MSIRNNIVFITVIKHSVYNWVSEVTQSCPTFVTPWTVAYQPPLSIEFSRQEYWSGLPVPSFSRGSSQPRDWIQVSCIAVYSSIHAWRIPWTEEPGRPQSMGSQRVQHDWATDTTTTAAIPATAATPALQANSLPSEPSGKSKGLKCCRISPGLAILREGMHPFLFPAVIHNWAGSECLPVSWKKTL